NLIMLTLRADCAEVKRSGPMETVIRRRRRMSSRRRTRTAILRTAVMPVSHCVGINVQAIAQIRMLTLTRTAIAQPRQQIAFGSVRGVINAVLVQSTAGVTRGMRWGTVRASRL